jgi:hypothetical protein
MSEIGSSGYDDEYPEWVYAVDADETTDELPPDPMYGDIVGDNLPTIPDATPPDSYYSTDLVPDHTSYYEPTPVGQGQDIVPYRPQQEVPTSDGVIYFQVNGKSKHHRVYRVPAPDGQVDAYALARAYLESVRDGADYPGEVRMNDTERRLISHYKEAQRRVAVKLGILSSVDYKLETTPYHIFTDKTRLDRAVIRQMDKSWLVKDRGTYTPMTGALWLRSNEPSIMHTGLARLVTLSSAATVAIPLQQMVKLGEVTPQVRRVLEERREQTETPNNVRRALGSTPAAAAGRELSTTRQPQPLVKPRPAAQQSEKIEILLGNGYQRPDVLINYNYTPGVHSAVGDMATARVLREAGYRGAPLFRNPVYNVVLDGVIRSAAQKKREHPQEVADELLRGYYNGQLDGLQRIHSALGRWGSYRLMTMSPGETRHTMRQLANDVGLPAISDRYNLLLDGKPVDLYRW